MKRYRNNDPEYEVFLSSIMNNIQQFLFNKMKIKD